MASFLSSTLPSSFPSLALSCPVLTTSYARKGQFSKLRLYLARLLASVKGYEALPGLDFKHHYKIQVLQESEIFQTLGETLCINLHGNLQVLILSLSIASITCKQNKIRIIVS